jgi:hypothetical protein
MDSKQLKAIENYVAALQKAVDEYEKRFQYANGTKIEVDYGRKYAKIVRASKSGSRSVHSFIEISTGNILKAANWNAPAKHVRGNVNAPDKGMSAVTAISANYLR